MGIPSIAEQLGAVPAGAFVPGFPPPIPSLVTQALLAGQQAERDRAELLQRKRQGQKPFGETKQGLIYYSMTEGVWLSMAEIRALNPDMDRKAVKAAVWYLANKNLIQANGSKTKPLYQKPVERAV